MSQTAEATKAAQASAFSIDARTGVGAVHLGVTDGARARDFYTGLVGLTVLGDDGDRIRLGSGGHEVVVLHPGADRPVVQRTSGLYHLAIVVPSRRELAKVIARLMRNRYPNSPTDHVMTKSDYLWDPDGNGIEIYVESPEDGVFGFADGQFMARDAQGRLRSGRDPIDLEALFGELQAGDRFDQPLPDESQMGHVHLHIRELAEAVGFYHGILGFDVMGVADRWGAAFVSAGGYHHHLGLNTWAGEGAPQAPPTAAGLRRYSVEVADETVLGAVTGRLVDAGTPVTEAPEAQVVRDPSGNLVHIQVRAK
ncbi:MAG: VOC family protein [Actinomycetota bacterium]